MAYTEVQYSKLSALDVVYMKPFVGFTDIRRSLCSPGLLLNIESFPIGIAFGDRDFNGSEGADWVVKSNAFFITGESQLFLLPNAGHYIVQGNPHAVVKMLTAFFFEDVSYVYQEKPREMWVPPRKANHPQGRPKL